MDSLWRDLRFAIRALANQPGLTLVAVLLLGLGIGANTAIFSVVDAIQLRPLPVPKPQQIVRVETSFRHGATEILQGNSSIPDFQDIRSQATAFAGLAWYSRRGAILEIGDQTELILSNDVSGNYFDVLGLTPAAGQFFTEKQLASPDALPVAVLGYGLWQRRFGGDVSIIGKAIPLNRRSVTVVGIAPKNFHGLDSFISPEIWIPAEQRLGEQKSLVDRNYRHFEVFGRLRPDAVIERAQTELNTIASRLAATFPATNVDRKLTVAYEKDRRKGGNLGVLLLAVSGLVLLIACANIANLLFARGEARRREIAVRLALGARRLRLVRQLLTESLLLSLLGGACASLLALWVIQLLPALMPSMAIRIEFDFRVDARVFAFTLGVSLLAVFLFGLIPAMRATRTDLAADLKTDLLTSAVRARRFSLRNALVVGQVALSLALLAGAGLVVHSLWNLRSTDPGFNARQNLLLVYYGPGIPGYDAAHIRTLLDAVREQLRALPGVEAVSLMRRFPLAGSGGGATRSLVIADQEIPPGESGIPVQYNLVDPDYFRVMSTRLLRGRAFTEQDSSGAPCAAIINETMGKRFWAKAEPVGQHFRFADAKGSDCEIVGVVPDGKYIDLREEPRPYLFLPIAQHTTGEMTIAVLTAREPQLLAAPVRTVLRQLDKNVPILDIITLDAHMRSALYFDRFIAYLSGALGLVGLFLAGVGLYGVVAFLVSRRTREIGVRMALGAEPRDVFRLVLGEGIRLTAIGIAMGFGLSFWVLRLLAGALFGVTSTAPWTYAAAAAILTVVTLAACYIPARRAARVSPVVALRCE